MLDVKKKEEQMRKAELIATTQKLTNARTQLLAQLRVLDGIMDELSQAPTASRLVRQEFFLKHSAGTDEQVRRIRTSIHELEQQRSRQAQTLRQVRRFREGLEKLRAKAEKRFFEQQDRIEQKNLDEMATIRFTRETATAGTDQSEESS